MRLSELFTSITEARVREPVLMYHGTSTAILRQILVNGVQPFPEKRVWADDEHAGGNVLSRKSMGGSYWTGDFMTAYGSARRALQKLGEGDRLIVAALINEQSAYADEDNINSPLKSALGALVGTLGYEGIFSNTIYLLPYFWGSMAKPAMKLELVDKFRHLLSKQLKEKFVLSREQALPIIEAFILRALSELDDYYQQYRLRDADIKDLAIPTKAEAEHRCWKIRQQLTKTFKKTAYRSDDLTWHTLRIEQPIGYRGRNHIVCVASIQYVKDQISAKSITVHYGEIPERMRSAYETSIGVWPEVIQAK